MAKTQVQLSEALKPHVGEEGAKLIAEVFPSSDELITKEFLRAELSEFKAEMRSWDAYVLRPTVDRRVSLARCDRLVDLRRTLTSEQLL